MNLWHLQPGPPATLADRHEVVSVRRLVTGELAATRRAALGWARGIGGIFAAMIGLGLVHGRVDVETLASPFAVVVGVAFVLAVIAGAVAALATMRAAHGRPLMTSLAAAATNAQTGDALSEHTEARRSIRALALGLSFAGVSTLSLLIALGTIWYAPTGVSAALAVIDDAGTSWCGTVTRVTNGAAILQTEDGIVRVDLGTAQSLHAVTECTP